jgi:hypothetical protein
MDDDTTAPGAPARSIRDGKNSSDFALLAIADPWRDDEFFDVLGQRPDPEQCRAALRQALDREQLDRIRHRRDEA